MDLADVLAHPFIEDGDQKIAITLRLDTLYRHGGRFRQAAQAQLRWCGEVQALLDFRGARLAFHHRVELDMPHALGLEKAIDLQRILRHLAGDGDQHIEFDPMAFQQCKAAHDIVETGPAALVRPIEVMDLAWSVKAEADHESLTGKKVAPLIIKQGAVGLQGIAYDLASGELALVVDRTLEKVEAQQRRFATLPGELHFRTALRCDIALHISTQHIIGHPEAFARRKQLFFFQIEAIAAIEITNRPDRLGHEVQALRGDVISQHY
ncbi:hypothetical protein D3C85_854010 [compost metagenome]